MSYVRFAVDCPAHFQVMFQPVLLHADDPELLAAKALAGAELRAGVAGLSPGRSATDARTSGISAWSLAHGFATLLLTGNLDGPEGPIGDRDPEEVFRSLTENLFRATGGENPS
ncbi:hypothetical protein GCM10009780_24100 [Actinomadura alba]